MFSMVLVLAPLQVIAQEEVQNKVKICHKTESEQNPWNAIEVSSNAVEAHLEHGDFLYEGTAPLSDAWCEEHAPEDEDGEGDNPKTSTVTLCKVDDKDQPLPGWTLKINDGKNEPTGDYSGTTGENGCVTFEDVEYGVHEAFEILKDGWEYVSGPNSGDDVVVNNPHVTIDEPTEKFTFKNKLEEEDTPPDQCVDELNGSWADGVVSSNQGDRKDGSDVLPARSNEGDTLGPSDWTEPDSDGFFSLGFGGWIIISFDSFVPDVAGTDLSIHEATNGSYPLEKATVEVSQNGTTWHLSGTADNSASSRITNIDFSSTGLAWIKFVRITDTSLASLFPSDADGFDVDAVKVTKQVCDEPEEEEEEEPNDDNDPSPTDVCDNIEGDQSSLPSGHKFATAGMCVPTECFDDIDNTDSEDALVDEADLGCWTDPNDSNTYNPDDDDETNPTPPSVDLPACSDGKDNDGDGKTDFSGEDPGCDSALDTDEIDSSDNNNGDNDTFGSTTSGSRARGAVLGAETSCGIYVDKFLRKGYKTNNTDAVNKVQQFLNEFMNAGLIVDGNFGSQTEAALKAFQTVRKDKILDPWSLAVPTGIFYLTTQTEVNNIMCPALGLPIPTNLIPFSRNSETPKI